jgi:hypothetical protein
VKQQKPQPRLDTGGPAQAAKLREVAPLLEELKRPLVDPKTNELTSHGRNLEMRTSEAQKAQMRAADPFFAEEERKQEQREKDKTRALYLDARLAALRIRTPAVTSVFRAFGEISPEAQALAARTLNSLNTDIIDATTRDGLSGAQRLISEYEQRVLPELKVRCTELQNEFMKKLSVEREKLAAEQALENAKRLGPDKAIKHLETNGLSSG